MTEHRKQASTRLPAEPASARAARTFLAQTLTGWSYPGSTELPILLANELVTNAIVHAGTQVTVDVTLAEGVLRLEVSDASAVPAVRVDVPPDAASGRGIALVEQVADRFGVEQRSGGKVVWVELRT